MGVSKSAGSSLAKGSRTVKENVLPLPGSLSTQIVPPIISTRLLQMDSPRPRASETPGRGGIGLGEGLKEMLQSRRRNSDSGVSHGEFQMGVVVVRPTAKTHLNFATLGELDRIAGQIQQDLLQSHRVADDGIRCLVGHPTVEGQPSFACPHAKGFA